MDGFQGRLGRMGAIELVRRLITDTVLAESILSLKLIEQHAPPPPPPTTNRRAPPPAPTAALGAVVNGGSNGSAVPSSLQTKAASHSTSPTSSRPNSIIGNKPPAPALGIKPKPSIPSKPAIGTKPGKPPVPSALKVQPVGSNKLGSVAPPKATGGQLDLAAA